MSTNNSLVFSNNVAVYPFYDDEPHKHSIYRDVGTLLDKYTRSSLFHLLLMVYVDNSYYFLIFNVISMYDLFPSI